MSRTTKRNPEGSGGSGAKKPISGGGTGPLPGTKPIPPARDKGV